MQNSDLNLKQLLGCQLTWVKPKFLSREYFLKANEEEAGHLIFKDIFSWQAEGAIGNERWVIKRQGPFKPIIFIYNPETGELETARYLMKIRGGVLTMNTGENYHWNHVSFWKGEWAFFDEASKEVIVKFTPHRIGFKMGVKVEINPMFHFCGNIPLMILLGSYLQLITMQNDGMNS